DRRRSGRGLAMGPEGYRRARWAMGLARQLRLPLVTIVDTPGARVTAESEEGGLAAEISACLAEMTALPSPTLCVLLGEGGGGGALALVPADRVVAAQHAWLAPIHPEGASAILHRSIERASEVAASQPVASWDLAAAGVVDVVVPELPSADREREPFVDRVVQAVGQELALLLGQEKGDRLAARRERYRRIGASGSGAAGP
ncbi:MAG: carboxyl transferase domain-containing protein, partial [Actinomycetota bacterium]